MWPDDHNDDGSRRVLIEPWGWGGYNGDEAAARDSGDDTPSAVRRRRDGGLRPSGGGEAADVPGDRAVPTSLKSKRGVGSMPMLACNLVLVLGSLPAWAQNPPGREPQGAAAAGERQVPEALNFANG